MRQGEPLRNWSDWLAWFAAASLQPVVLELLQHLSPLLNVPRPVVCGVAQHAEGLETVLHRGDYQNLLLSEWLLADELPDEFLRRAAQHEHLFLAPLPQEKEGGKRIVALFDTGPEQLGAPRLAQMALLILLARRAALIGGTLDWSPLAVFEGWQEMKQATDLRRFLKERCWALPDAAGLEAWHARFHQDDLATSERWLICAPDSLPRPPVDLATHLVTIGEDLKERKLHVHLRGPRGTRLRVDLRLPPNPLATRLLRGDFGDAPPGEAAETSFQHPGRPSLLAPMTLSFDGGIVALRSQDLESILLIHTTSKKPRRRVELVEFPSGTQLVGAGFSFGNLCSILKADGVYSIWDQKGKFATQSHFTCENIDPPSSTPNLAPFFWLNHKTNHYMLSCIDNDKNFLHLDVFEDDEKSPLIIFNSGIILTFIAKINESSIAYITTYPNDNEYYLSLISTSHEELPGYDLGQINAASCFFIAGGRQWFRGFGGMAVQTGPHWRVYRPSENEAGFQQEEVSVPAPYKVLGCIFRKKTRQVALVVWNRRQVIGALCEGKFEHWFTAPSFLARVDLCSATGGVAMLSLEREFFYYHPTRKKVLVNIAFGQEAS